MIAKIEENKLGESIKIRHIGMLKENGQELFDGPEIDSWKNNEESYKFENIEGHTRLICSVDVEETIFSEIQMREMWLRALRKLKEICED